MSQDSAIARTGLFFDLALLDENAASHVALGFGYLETLAGSGSLSSRELTELGFNRSDVHTDVMFGSKEVTIVATRSREGEVVLIDRGRWGERFLEL